MTDILFPEVRVPQEPAVSAPQHTATAPDLRKLLVDASFELALQLERVDSIEERFETDAANSIAEARRAQSHINDLRSVLAEAENVVFALKRRLISDENVLQSARKDAYEAYKSVLRRIEILRAKGSEFDRDALDAMFGRSWDVLDSSPFKLPGQRSCFSLAELMHETYEILRLRKEVLVPDFSTAKVCGIFPELAHPDNKNRRFLKLVRCFKRANRPDVFHFFLCDAGLEARQKTASLYGVVRRYRSLSSDFHGQPLGFLCWFGACDAPVPPFPSCNGDTFDLTALGTDYGAHDCIFSTGEKTPNNTQLIASLAGVARNIGFVAGERSEKLTLSPDWQSHFWKRRVPLEFVGDARHQPGACVMNCTPLAVRVKMLKSSLGSEQPVDAVFACLCLHEPTKQVFWYPLTDDLVASLGQGLEVGAASVETCSCAGTHNDRVRHFETPDRPGLSVPNSPLEELRRSNAAVFDEHLMSYYSSIADIANSHARDPAELLADGKRAGEALPSPLDMFPAIGMSTVAPSSDGVLRASAKQTRLEEDEEEQQHHRSSKKKKSAVPSAEEVPTTTVDTRVQPKKLVALTAGGNNKKSRPCPSCGLEGFKLTTHLTPNHGYRGTLSQEELVAWRASLVKEHGEELAQTLVAEAK